MKNSVYSTSMFLPPLPKSCGTYHYCRASHLKGGFPGIELEDFDAIEDFIHHLDTFVL